MEKDLIAYLSKYITLTDKEVEAVINLNLIQRFKKGTTLLQMGEVSNKCYFVLKGCIRSYYLIDGEEKTTEFYTEEQSVTPSCYTKKTPSEYFLVCAEDCILAVGTSEMEESFYEKYPKFATLTRIMTEEIVSDNQLSFDKYKNLSPEERYLDLMKNRHDLLQRVPQHQIASYLGIKPESLSRIRKRLSKP